MAFLWVAIGGGLGSCLRYALALGFEQITLFEGFPFGTFAANVSGSFGLGVVFVLGEDASWFGTDARVFLGTGVMGGFTTYSAFNLETLALIEAGAWGRAAVYMSSTVLVCILAGVAGLWLGRALRPA